MGARLRNQQPTNQRSRRTPPRAPRATPATHPSLPPHPLLAPLAPLTPHLRHTYATPAPRHPPTHSQQANTPVLVSGRRVLKCSLVLSSVSQWPEYPPRSSTLTPHPKTRSHPPPHPRARFCYVMLYTMCHYTRTTSCLTSQLDAASVPNSHTNPPPSKKLPPRRRPLNLTFPSWADSG